MATCACLGLNPALGLPLPHQGVRLTPRAHLLLLVSGGGRGPATTLRTQKYAVAEFAQVDESLVKVPDLQERDLAMFLLEFSKKRPHTLHILRQGVERQSLGALQGHTLAFPLADARAVRVVRVAENARHLVIDAGHTIIQTTSAPVLRPRLDARRSDGL